ncbi:MAG: hypothetical protein J5U19_12360 [Candidatus Methanoperedens sp.]|nr:hypothetical protein [Candidatus Methanoperedens sp.]
MEVVKKWLKNVLGVVKKWLICNGKTAQKGIQEEDVNNEAEGKVSAADQSGSPSPLNALLNAERAWNRLIDHPESISYDSHAILVDSALCPCVQAQLMMMANSGKSI